MPNEQKAIEDQRESNALLLEDLTAIRRVVGDRVRLSNVAIALHEVNDEFPLPDFTDVDEAHLVNAVSTLDKALEKLGAAFDVVR